MYKWKSGKFAYKTGFSFTKRESRLQNEIFIYKERLLGYKRDSRSTFHQKCKKWLKNITTETDVVYDGTIYHATNVPAKICPECGKITIYEIIQERIVQYATQRNVKNIDYAECENEEASASQLILWISILTISYPYTQSS